MAPDFSHNKETVDPVKVCLLHHSISFHHLYYLLFLDIPLNKVTDKLTKGDDRLLRLLLIMSHKTAVCTHDIISNAIMDGMFSGVLHCSRIC